LTIVRNIEFGRLNRLLPRQRVEKEEHQWQQEQVAQGHQILRS
jgi:uncharacterized protein YqiB (DUF1249 family)